MALLAGLAIVSVVALDVLRTVFDVSTGGGPVTGRTSAALWRLAVARHHRAPRHRRLESYGVLIALSVILTWLVLLWLGWTLVAASQPEAFVVDQTGAQATFWERAYTIGGQLFSLSLGDVRADTTRWRLLQILVVASGLLVATLAVTYLVPVVRAATERRQVAAYLAALADDVDQLTDLARRGALDQPLSTITPTLFLLAELHLAYPVLHFFHSADPRTALAPMLARLHVALAPLDLGPESPLDLTRRAVAVLARDLDLRPGRAPDDVGDALDAALWQDGWTWDDALLGTREQGRRDGRVRTNTPRGGARRRAPRP